jgi:hypothetical protein
METDKKPSAIADTMFELSKSYSNVSRTATLYSRLNMIMDMKIFLADEEKKVREEIDKNDIIK